MIKTISLRIETPTGAPLPGRGFYQLEDETLYVPVGDFDSGRPFFNYLESESEQVRFDIDRDGRLMLIEVDLPRRRWPVKSDVSVPAIADTADIRWLDFRTRVIDPALETNERRDALLLRFSETAPWRWYQLTEALFLQVDGSGHLAAVLITSIEDDIAGSNLAAFRKWMTKRLTRSRAGGRRHKLS
jgi:hypothetical protein